ncbi:hypothetical protein B0O99DRAFT_591050 [Bisporella sp. PMI_857]|nr:hypothetical protein B0O99DRAFT_591050 [Bisporella sp. PMI_857]
MKPLYFLALFAVAASARRQHLGPKENSNETATNGTVTSPCAAVSASSAAAMATNVLAYPIIPAQLAQECLTSVPLNKTEAATLIKSILPYVEWQSDTSYLKNPPPSYQQPPIDIWGLFTKILSNIESGAYANEQEFQADLYRSFNSVHDGHFRFVPDLLSKAVSFFRPVSLVSVSKDGMELPKIYERSDIRAYNAGLGSNSSLPASASLPSEVIKINGEDAVKFLTNLAQLGALQDPDALYNNLFYEMAIDAQERGSYDGYFAGSGRFGNIFPGSNTTIEFANETVNIYENQAAVIGNFSLVVDGETFYERFCTGPHLQRYYSNVTYPFPSPPPLPPTDVTPPTGYPTPIVVSGDTQVSGYFLDDADPRYADVAVLSMLTFAPNFPIEFQSVIETFITKARAAGKTKLVIDLFGNGGGTILVGYDAFRQLFPSITQDGFSRFREHEAFRILSEQISLYSTKFDASTADDEQIFAYTSPPNYHYDLNVTNQNFLSYDDKFSPRIYNGDEFTANMRWNLNEPLTTINTTWGVGEEITGYGTRTNFTQPFEAMDIIMIYDGYCASTCSLFSEFMRLQAGVKSIAFGGRPTKSPIQAIGGTKGANNYPYGYIKLLATVPLNDASPEQTANWTSLTAYTDLPINRSTDTSLNVRDQILRPNLIDGTPAQFIYEEADCRVFFEPRMISDVKSVWKRAVDVAWGGAKCIAGGFPGNETLAIRRRKSEELKLKAQNDRKPYRKFASEAFKNKPLSPAHGRKVPL